MLEPNFRKYRSTGSINTGSCTPHNVTSDPTQRPCDVGENKKVGVVLKSQARVLRVAGNTHRPSRVKQGGQSLTCPGSIDEVITQIMGKAVTVLKGHFLYCLPKQMLRLQAKKLQQYLRELRYILYIYETQGRS